MASAFRLTYAFSITSLIGIGVLSLTLGLLYQRLAETTLIEHESHANTNLARSLANSLLTRYHTFVTSAGRLDTQAIQTHPRLHELQDEVAQLTSGLRIMKIHIFDRSGITIFSNETVELGSDHSASLGFRSAMAGEVFSRIVPASHQPHTEKSHHDHEDMRLWHWLKFDITEHTYLASYIPMRDESTSNTFGVLEIYSDITPLIEKKNRSGLEILGIIIGLMLTLYLFLLMYVRRADGIIRDHEKLTRMQQEERIRYLAHHDDLTGLPNRALLFEMLKQMITHPTREGRIAVIALGLDRFRMINESLGHEGGDRVLVEAARHIESSLSGHHQLFRLGGDEFAIVDTSTTTPQESGKLASDLLHALEKPLQLEHRGKELTVTASIGISFYPDDSDSAEELVAYAISAMADAKSYGGACHTFYTRELNSANRERLELELSLRHALDKQEFTLNYQPKVNALSNRVVGLEALLRWRSSEHGPVSPARFVPLLESTGMMVAVGNWVIDRACHQAAKWQKSLGREFRVAINVSLKQLKNGNTLIETVQRALDTSGLPPYCLELELTESVLAENIDEVATTLHRLKELGVFLTIDDFGTGYSSLSYLSKLPIDVLKIDIMFTRDIHKNQHNATITSAIISLARSLGLDIVAEGIESEEQLAFMQEMGCPIIQGYLFSAPVTANRLPHVIEQIEASAIYTASAGEQYAPS